MAPKTCLPPVFILKAGNSRIPIWPNPPRVLESERPIFGPKELRSAIVERFRIHLHQHPKTPLNDEALTLQLTRYIEELCKTCISSAFNMALHRYGLISGTGGTRQSNGLFGKDPHAMQYRD